MILQAGSQKPELRSQNEKIRFLRSVRLELLSRATMYGGTSFMDRDLIGEIIYSTECFTILYAKTVYTINTFSH